MKRDVLFLLIAMLLLPGCVKRVAPGLDAFAPAHGPHGIHARLTVRSQPLRGELLEVMDDGLLILSDSRIHHATWAAITNAVFEDYEVPWRSRRPPADEHRIRLALVSRHPPGLTTEQRSALLEASGQSEPVRHTGEIRQSGETPATHHEAAATGVDSAAREDPRVARFLERTAETLERYGDRDRALLAGYRPLGPDFPGMGVHWLNTEFLFHQEPDPRRPQVLTYLDTPAGPVLTGAAFVLVLAPDESPPGFPAPGAWHHHAGTVDEEALALNPAAALHSRGDEPRVTMLHAWIGIENPDGVFAQDNWALPFLRLGLAVPTRPAPAAGKALYLASGGDAYYARLMGVLTSLTPAEEEKLERILTRHRLAVERLLAELGAGADGARMQELSVRLEDVWLGLWTDVRAALPPATWERVGVLGL